jgi:hypothetical protein
MEFINVQTSPIPPPSLSVMICPNIILNYRERKAAGKEYWYQPARSYFTFPFYRHLKAIWVETGQNMYPGVVQ